MYRYGWGVLKKVDSQVTMGFHSKIERKPPSANDAIPHLY